VIRKLTAAKKVKNPALSIAARQEQVNILSIMKIDNKPDYNF